MWSWVMGWKKCECTICTLKLKASKHVLGGGWFGLNFFSSYITKAAYSY